MNLNGSSLSQQRKAAELICLSLLDGTHNAVRECRTPALVLIRSPHTQLVILEKTGGGDDFSVAGNKLARCKLA